MTRTHVKPPARTEPAPSVMERRNRIVAVTRELIGELGIEGITMRDLALRCNVAVATLYNQFGSREAIIADALRMDFEGRYQPFPGDVGPADRLEARVTASTRAIIGPMRDYTRSVMFFYFHYNPDSSLRATIHDFVAADFTEITEQIASRGDLQPWVNPRLFADDLITQLYALVAKWTQGYIPDNRLKQRLLQAAVASFIGISRGRSRREFEALALRQRPSTRD